jgi:hypothetical protein
MKRFRFGRPSPAIIVAVVALVAALAGTAVAGPGAGSSALNKAKVKLISQKQARKVLKADAASLEVGSAAALTQLEYVRSNTVQVGTLTDGSAIASCPSGKFATGGGGVTSSQNDIHVIASHPANGNQGQAGYTAWEYRVRNQGGSSIDVRAYVVCASAKATPANYNAGEAAG